MSEYDCTDDVKLHRWSVSHYMKIIILELVKRADEHDASKLQEPEKSMFDEFTPCLKTAVFGSDEYKAVLANMGESLKHHYANNRHHPEFFENGVNGMTLTDVVEMVSDWKAAAFLKGEMPNLNYLSERFHIDPQLLSIIADTLRELEE